MMMQQSPKSLLHLLIVMFAMHSARSVDTNSTLMMSAPRPPTLRGTNRNLQLENVSLPLPLTTPSRTPVDDTEKVNASGTVPSMPVNRSLTNMSEHAVNGKMLSAQLADCGGYRATLPCRGGFYLASADTGRFVNSASCSCSGWWPWKTCGCTRIRSAREGASLIFHGTAAGVRLRAELTGAGDGSFYLKDSVTGLYVHPSGGHAGKGVSLNFWNGHGYRIAFKAEGRGHGNFYLKSAEHSSFYVHPEGGHAEQDQKLHFWHGNTGWAIALKIVT